MPIAKIKKYFVQTAHTLANVSPSALAKKPYLRWAAPVLQDPRLWALERESVRRGAAIGAFVSIITPFFQFIVALVLALWSRVHIPSALIGTLFNTPLTFAPVYWLAYKIGETLLDVDKSVAATTGISFTERFGALALGSLVVAIGSSLLCYFIAGFVFDKIVSPVAKKAKAIGLQSDSKDVV